MRPLEHLPAAVRSKLSSAPVDEAEQAIELLDPTASGAATTFARALVARRRGDRATGALFEASASAFLQEGDGEAASIATSEAWLARVGAEGERAHRAAIVALSDLARDAATNAARASAQVALGAVTRAAGDAVGSQRALLDALASSEGLLEERARALNTLGTLYVVLGAHGAAEALLEHAVELQRRLGDRVGEAIAHGQLGAAAAALGDRERAKQHLSRQEWLAAKIGDRHGQARSLVWLSELAREAGHADEGEALAERALTIAEAPAPLSLWVAHAKRVRGRARAAMESPAARADLIDARARFTAFGNPLGVALTGWDLAILDAREGKAAGFDEPALGLGALGVAPRVAELLLDAGAEDRAILAAAQAAPHLGAAHEIALVYDRPEALIAIASRRTEASRNLGRLAALSIAPRGLVIAIVVARAAGPSTLPPESRSCASVGALPGLAVWAWPRREPVDFTPIVEATRILLAALGADARARIVDVPDARVVAPPFLGDVGAELEGLDLAELAAQAFTLAPGELITP
jgi:tetratricopeptide (TPR) repeat protein